MWYQYRYALCERGTQKLSARVTRGGSKSLSNSVVPHCQNELTAEKKKFAKNRKFDGADRVAKSCISSNMKCNSPVAKRADVSSVCIVGVFPEHWTEQQRAWAVMMHEGTYEIAILICTLSQDTRKRASVAPRVGTLRSIFANVPRAASDGVSLNGVSFGACKSLNGIKDCLDLRAWRLRRV
eukprot:COSAG02_NODE_8532_length_2534_cov_2.115400_2_plen_182_part_00